jgi:protein transport protein SEC31
MRHVSTNAPGGPNGKFKKHLEDTDHRLAILFDHLNNEELLTPDTIQEMNELAGFLQNKQFDEAMATCTDLITNKTDQGTDWMVCISGSSPLLVPC